MPVPVPTPREDGGAWLRDLLTRDAKRYVTASYRQDAKIAKNGAGRFPVVRDRRRCVRPAPFLAILASWR